MPRIKRGQLQPKSLLVLVLYIQTLMTVKSATSLMMTMETNSRRAKGLAICEVARTLRETSLKINRVVPKQNTKCEIVEPWRSWRVFSVGRPADHQRDRHTLNPNRLERADHPLYS